jgi:hypothetical protein
MDFETESKESRTMTDFIPFEIHENGFAFRFSPLLEIHFDPIYHKFAVFEFAFPFDLYVPIARNIMIPNCGHVLQQTK